MTTRNGPPQHTARALDIVVIDDNRDNADALAELLDTFGHRVRVAYVGGKAIQLLTEHHADVVFLDVNLPDTDGYTVAASLRARFGRDVRLVALTGFSGRDAYARADAAGFDSFIVKPPALKDVEKALE